MSEQVYDVVVATDARLPGGTTGSAAEEIVAQSRAGLRTGLLHLPSSLSATARPFAPRLRSLVLDGSCDVITGAEVRCSLLVLRHPRVAAEIDPAHTPRIRAEQVELVANQAAGSPGGGFEHYDPHLADRALAEWTGRRPRWSPIGPLVRANLAEAAPGLVLDADDWVNIIDLAPWRTSRRAPGTPVRIGRHSRNHPLKWPATREELLAAYPDAPDISVHVLGGADAPAALLGGSLPDNWHVTPFGAMSPERFLAGIDVFVYHHHPRWVEAFGRTVIEAMASGAPTVLAPHFGALFGDAAVYATPAETLVAIRELTASPDRYLERSARARALVAERFSHATHLERLERRGVSAPTARSGAVDARVLPTEDPPRSDPGGQPRQRVLLVSSNGAGVGHLMRLMAVARRLPDDLEPVVLTLSQAVGVVRDLGYHVEYLPSRGALGAPHRPWHALLRARVVELIDELDVRAVVFDGTWPYDGLLDAFEDRPGVLRVWSRRALWRAEITRHVLHHAPRFDLVVEPGELAGDDDRGATRARRHETCQVGPITFLRADEPLGREDAREQLDLAPDGRAALVQLGAGNINDTRSLLGSVVEQLHAADPALVVCVTRSAIGTADTLPEGVRAVSAYPLARNFAAFDVAVAASGYNTFHELVLASVPTLFVPNTDTATDDQLARARWAERVGIARCVSDPTPAALRQALAHLVPAEARASIATAHERLVRPGDGGQEAAAAIAELLRDPDEVRARRRGPEPVGDEPEVPPRVRLRHAVEQLPPPARELVVRGWRLAKGRRASTAGNGRIPVPRGRGWDDSTSSAMPRGVLILLSGSVDDASIDDIVRDTAALQRTLGGFAPLFVTDSARLAPFREHGYGVEVLPDPEVLANLLDPARASIVRGERLREISRRYAIERLVTIDDPEETRSRLYALV